MRVLSAFYRFLLLKTLSLSLRRVLLSVLPIRKALTGFDGSLAMSTPMRLQKVITATKLRLLANGYPWSDVRAVKLVLLRFSGLEYRETLGNGGDTNS